MIIEMTGVTNSSAFQKLEDESNVLSSDHRNLNGIYTDGLGLLRKKSLGEIFFKNGLWPEINHRILDGIYTETKSLEES